MLYNNPLIKQKPKINFKYIAEQYYITMMIKTF